MATESEKNRAEELIKQAQLLQDGKEWQRMIPLLDDAINLDPDNPEGLSWRGFAYNELGEYEKALKDLDRSIEMDPSSDAAWSNRGFAKNQLGQHEAAISDLNESIKINPKNYSAWNNRGFAKNELGQHEAAISDYDEAIKINPKHYSSFMNRGWCYYALNMLRKAEQDFEDAIKISPENAKVAVRGLLAIAIKQDVDESTKKLQEENRAEAELFSGNTDELLKRSKDCEEEVYLLDDRIFAAWLVMLLLMLAYFCFILYPVLEDVSENIDAFSIGHLFAVSTLLIIIFPFVWAIRILLTAKEKREILREDYYRRAMADATIRKVFRTIDPADDSPELRASERQVWIDYINEWLRSSAAELMLQHRSKTGGDGQQPLEIILNETRKSLSGEKDK